jgi:cystathionine beta-lyase/cystathionine gamma-synthase
MQPNTRLLFLELPTNPTMRVFDPRPVGRLAAEAGVMLVADCTFASPVNFRGREHGIDVVIHSATKYLGGHSDLIAGVVAGSRSLIKEVQAMLKLYGPALDPHAAWLLERGMRTLALRMERHNHNGQVLAEWLEQQPEVDHVLYPGLASHPDHTLATKLLDGFGGMIGLVLRGGGAAADTFCSSLGLAIEAPSLGGVETLVSQPRFTSHMNQTPAERAEQGIPDGFIRISTGVEDAPDLERDFRQALDALQASAVA